MSNLESRRSLILIATYAAVIVSCILVATKIVAWRLSGSLSLQASLIDSLLDSMSSIVNFFIIRQAVKPADAEHRFGHGKAEALAGMGEAIFIAASALWLTIEAVHRLFFPVKLIKPTFLGNSLMLSAIVLTFILVLFQHIVVKRTKSVAIAADALHYRGDLLITIGVFVSLNGAAYFDWGQFDVFVAIFIAGYILVSSWKIGVHALHILMDRELPNAIREEISAIALGHSRVQGIHDLRTRSSGQSEFIQMHLELEGSLSLIEAHEITQEVAEALYRKFPDAEVIIHQDPIHYPNAE